MTHSRLLFQALFLTSLALAGCSGEGATAEDGAGSAWAAVAAGTCTPDCTGRACGVDPVCGVSCGLCASGQSCNEESGQCVAECVPDCTGRTCGVDPVCGISCGSCGSGTSCNDAKGVCEAAPKPHQCPGGRRGNGGRRWPGWHH